MSDLTSCLSDRPHQSCVRIKCGPTLTLWLFFYNANWRHSRALVVCLTIYCQMLIKNNEKYIILEHTYKARRWLLGLWVFYKGLVIGPRRFAVDPTLQFCQNRGHVVEQVFFFFSKSKLFCIMLILEIPREYVFS